MGDFKVGVVTAKFLLVPDTDLEMVEEYFY